MTDNVPHDLARVARSLVRGCDRAALATSLPAEAGPWPYASLVLTAVDHDLSPILLLSDLAEHSKAIAGDDRVSLLFDGTEGLDQPLTGPRVTVVWLGAAELMAAPPPPGLADAEEGIVSHMNEDHGDALQLYAGKLLGLSGIDWRMTGIDAEGIDLRQGGRVARLTFDTPLQTVSEARKVLVALVAKARAA